MSARITPSGGVAEGTRLSLNDAQSHLAAAEDALNGWYARQTAEGHTYVADGHEAIHFLYELLRELQRVRPALIGEIRTDKDARAVRIDRLLAACRAEREAASAVVDDPRPEVGA